MKEKTTFYWNITKEKEENKEESSRTNDDWNDMTNEKIENLLKENFEDNYEKWKQIDSATKFLEENNRLDEKIGTCIVDIFYKIGYEYEMERSCLENIFNRIIKYISSDDYWKIINRIVYKYREDNDEYSIRLCSENLNWLIQKILINEGNVEKMKEYFYISIGKHRSWITGANHIKTIDINIVTQEHYLKEPNNLKELVVNILLIQLGSQNIHRMEIAYKAINLMCMYDNEVIKIISQNWKHLNRTQKEQFHFMAERWIFENKEKYIPFFEKLVEENEISNTITDKIQLLYLLEKYNKQVFELKTNKLNYKENKIDFFEELVISTQFEYICNEIDIKHYIRNAEMLLKDNCIDLKRELLLTYDANEKVDNKNIKARPGDFSLPYYKNSEKFEEILYNEFTKGRWGNYSLLRLIQTFGRNDDGCFMTYYPQHIFNVEKWEDEERLTQFIEKHNMKDMKNSIISKINDGINTEKEICIGAAVYIPVKRKEGYEIIYSKNIKSNYSKEKNFYSIMPSYKILYCEEKELFETDVIVKSICNKICGLTYGVNSNIRIALSNIFVNKLKLKLKSIEPLVFTDDKNREVKFEWIMYPYRDNIQESYVRYQTLYRWVCNKELFDEFLNKNNLQVIDNMDIQETQI